MTIEETLDAREKTHGDFEKVSMVAQEIKGIVSENATHTVSVEKREAIDMIATKIARIVCGNPNDPDHWLDIEGYARLVRERIENE